MKGKTRLKQNDRAKQAYLDIKSIELTLSKQDKIHEHSKSLISIFIKIPGFSVMGNNDKNGGKWLII